MAPIAVILAIFIVVSVVILRLYLFSLFTYFSAKVEPRKTGFEALNSLRQSLIHERKKKTAGLEMILSSWERGDEIQPRYEYFEELLDQLKGLIRSEKRNLMAVSPDVWLWAKLWKIIRRIEKHSRENRERSDVAMLREALAKLRELLDQTVEDATRKFSFSLNDAVKESVKTVRIEKSRSAAIEIREQLDEVGDSIRFSYAGFKEWQRLLTNLIRNAVEAVEAKYTGAGVAEVFRLRGEEEKLWVKVTTEGMEAGIGRAGVPDLREDESSISRGQGSQPCTVVAVVIEDSGIGMDEATSLSFFKKGFTSGKDHGLGLGVTEESVQFVEQYGRWEIESEKGVGTRIRISIDKQKSKRAELLLPPPKPFFRTRWALGLSFSFLALVALTLLFIFDKHSRFWVDWNPAYAKVEQGRQVAVFNSAGEELWRHQFQRNVSSTEDQLGNRSPLIKIADLDEDGWNETVVAIVQGVEVPGQVFCFDDQGKVKWMFSAGKRIEDSSLVQKGVSTPEVFEVRDLLVDDLVHDTRKEVLVTSVLHAFYPCQLALLNHQGHVTGEYWHPGLIRFSIHGDLDGDGEKELLCAGINNKLNCRAVLFTLGVKELVGKVQGPPYSIFSDIKPATEKKYIVFPHVKDVPWNWVEASVFATPRHMDIRRHHIFLMLPDGRHYSLTKNLEYVSCEHRIASFTNWQKMLKFPHEFNLDRDSLSWKSFEIWEKGVKVK